MTKKAESLSDIVNLFKPMALTEKQQAFYQKTAAVRDGAPYEFHDGLFERIRKSDTSERLLVVGHGGCGKSTELNMLMGKLSADSFPVIYVTAQDDLDLYSFNYLDIFMLIVERMAQYAEKHSLTVDKGIIAAFQKALSTKITQDFWNAEAELEAEGSVSLSVPFALFIRAIAKITASLKMASGLKEELRRELRPRIYDVIASLNAFIGNISDHASKKVVIIIDGLEKCRQENVRKLFIEDIVAIADIKAHLVVSCPISVYRSSDAALLSGYFSSPVVIPMIKTHNIKGKPYDAGVNVIRELVQKRADSSFFEGEVLDKIISKAGGSLRDTCYLLSNSAFEADMRGREIIDMESLDFTIGNFAVDVFFRVDAKLYSRAQEIYDGDNMAKQDPELTQLLYCGAAFEYNGDRWVDLHPLVREYIQAHPGVLAR